jgi:DivIVA domain-containing protein
MAITAENVRQTRFERAPLGNRGYHEPDVDAFMKRIASTLDGEDKLTAQQVHEVTFALSPLGSKRGYDRALVDAFLRLVASTLANHSRTGGDRVYVAPALEATHVRQPIWRRIRG